MSTKPISLSRADRRLLSALQEDATLSQLELAERAGMSRSSVGRRIRDFESAGLIERQVAILDPARSGFSIEVQLAVAMIEHTDENRRAFEAHVNRLDAVTECFSVSGERDYVLHVVVPDMDAYTNFLNTSILAHPTVRSASSTFVLKRVKYTTSLPLETLG
jgi:Lrp/AsnC family transcriptional regulator